MKKDSKYDVYTAPPKRRFKFALTKGFVLYVLLWFGALVFTQALRSHISALMFVFVSVLPIISLLYMFTAAAAVTVFAKTSEEEAAKYAPLNFSVDIINGFPLPYPFLEADILLPNENAIRCIEKRVGLSLAPFHYYSISENIVFKYRGQYDIGVSKIYAYDLFRLFRMTIDIDVSVSIFVVPRRLVFDPTSAAAASDVNTDSMKNITGIDRSELNEIRDYRNGDHMKTIHWKLSSKTQELMVKEYTMNSGKNVYIFVDLAAHYDIAGNETYSQDINEYVADGVIETALAAATRELKEGNNCTVMWYDKRVEGGTQICFLETPDDLNRMFKIFATADLCGQENKVSGMAALVEETQSVTLMFVSGVLDEEIIEELSEVTAVYGNLSSRGAIELYYFSAANKVIGDKVRADFVDFERTCSSELAAGGVRVFQTNSYIEGNEDAGTRGDGDAGTRGREDAGTRSL
jgi:uncharacterized protein (DUF58 family)